MTDLYDRALAPSGLLATQFSVLRKLQHESKNVSELAALLQLDRTTLTRNLTVLEGGGLIRIGVGEDRRERVVALTAKGRKSLEKAVPLWKNAQSALKERLGDAKYAEFLRLLEQAARMRET